MCFPPPCLYPKRTRDDEIKEAFSNPILASGSYFFFRSLPWLLFFLPFLKDILRVHWNWTANTFK